MSGCSPRWGVNGREEALAKLDGLVDGYLQRGWEISSDNRDRPTRSKPAPMPASFELGAGHGGRLATDGFATYNGVPCPILLVPVPLRFAHPDLLAQELRSWPHLSDWLVRNSWPKSLVPLAIPNPDSTAHERLIEQANPSETEQFFCVDTTQAALPVSLWSVDAGFERLFPSLERFLATLAGLSTDG